MWKTNKGLNVTKEWENGIWKMGPWVMGNSIWEVGFRKQRRKKGDIGRVKYQVNEWQVKGKRKTEKRMEPKDDPHGMLGTVHYGKVELACILKLEKWNYMSRNGTRDGKTERKKRNGEKRRDGWKIWDSLHDWKSELYGDRICLIFATRRGGQTLV